MRMKSPLVKPAEGGGGSSFVGLGEREVPGSLVTAEVGLPRKRRTPFIVPMGLEATVGQAIRVFFVVRAAAGQWNRKSSQRTGEKKT